MVCGAMGTRVERRAFLLSPECAAGRATPGLYERLQLPPVPPASGQL